MIQLNYMTFWDYNIHIVYEDQSLELETCILRSVLNTGTYIGLFIHKWTKQNAEKVIFREECLNCFKSEKSILNTGNIQDYDLIFLLSFEKRIDFIVV